MADPVYKFTASARIPTRPLSYENKDEAQPKEIVVDYENHRMYICGLDGKLYDVTADVTDIINKLIQYIKEHPSEFNFGDTIINIHIEKDDEHPDGPYDWQISIEQAITKLWLRIDYIEKLLGVERDENGDIKKTLDSLIEKIKLLEKILNIIRDEQGKIIRIDLENVFINATQIITDATHRFVTDYDIENWYARSKIFQLIAQIQPKTDNSNPWVATDDGAPYIQKVNITEIKETDYPIIDILLSDSYDIAMDQLNSYSKIYKVTTADGYIKVYATEPTTSLIKIQIKVDRGGKLDDDKVPPETDDSGSDTGGSGSDTGGTTGGDTGGSTTGGGTTGDTTGNETTGG